MRTVFFNENFYIHAINSIFVYTLLACHVKADTTFKPSVADIIVDWIPVVGGVVAAFILIVMIAILAVLCYRRCKRKNQQRVTRETERRRQRRRNRQSQQNNISQSNSANTNPVFFTSASTNSATASQDLGPTVNLHSEFSPPSYDNAMESPPPPYNPDWSRKN